MSGFSDFYCTRVPYILHLFGTLTGKLRRGSSDGVDLYLKYDLTFHIFNLENEIFENFKEISGQIFG